MQKTDHNYVAIMAGGIGSRFWPSSTEETPKQFLDITGTGKSLLRITYERFLKFIPNERIFVVTHADYVDQVQEHLPELDSNQILSEPSRNNTAPGIAYAAFKIHNIDPKARLIMAPSDHIILKEEEFISKISLALNYCSKYDALVTLGILPSRPDTGYGYINFLAGKKKEKVKKVIEFKEKPDLQTALEYLDSGNYLWNSGMFIWRTKVILEAFKEHASDVYDILYKGLEFYNTSKENAFIEKNFPLTPSISVDYAIMENAANIYTIPADIGWSDLGTWNALHAFLPKDEDLNAIYNSKKIVENSTNNLVKTQKGKTVILKNVHNFIIIEEEDVLLIYPKNNEQEIRKVRDLFKKL